jgi:Delta3-Delta2-enoyl-CoA isomerase
MALIEHTLNDHVAVLTLNSDDNRFNPQFIQTFMEVLEQLEKETEATAMIVKSAHGKIFSNGLDLDWLRPHIEEEDSEIAIDFFLLLNQLFKRILSYPMITVAAISGHAFAAGAIFCCAFDFRFMRSDRGFFCLPEIDLGIPFLPGMLALLKKAIPLYKFDELQYTGKRLTAFECEKHHIITQASPMDKLLEDALAFAGNVNKKREVIREMKTRANRKIIQILDAEDPVYIKSKKFIY